MQNSRKSLQLLCTATQNLTLKCTLANFEPPTFGGVLALSRRPVYMGVSHRARNKKQHPTNVSSLFKPVQVQHNADEFDVGSELAGKLEKPAILKILNKFTQRREVKLLCAEHGLDREYK